MELETVIENGRKAIENLGETLNDALNLDNLKERQNGFLNSSFGQAVDSAVNTGLKIILPDKIEDEIIEVKNALVQGGFKEATSKAIEVSIGKGKEILGAAGEIFTDISDVKKAVEKGGMIGGISKAIDVTLDNVKSSKLLPKEITNLIKAGKNLILDNVSKEVDNTLNDQAKAIEKIDKYCTSWENALEKGNIKTMEKQIANIDKQLEEVTPLVDTIKKVNEIKNQHEILKNKEKNGEELKLTEEEKELCKKFN